MDEGMQGGFNAPKLCRACRYYAPGGSRHDDRCLHESSAFLEPVRGETNNMYCSILRDSRVPARCGPEGKLWEAKS